MLNSCFASFQPVAAIATNSTAAQILQPVSQATGATLWLPESVENTEQSQYYHSSLKKHLTSIWSSHQAIIFCLAAGAVVRLIAPLLENKQQDPAVVVIDSEGRYVISLCGGHQGGGDLLTRLIADLIGADPVITGATNSRKLPPIDTLGIPFGWRKGKGDWTGVMAAVARDEPVEVIQEVGSTLWQEHLPEQHNFKFGFNETTPKARIWISPMARKFAPKSDFPRVQWHPRVLWVGIGCERGTSRRLIETAINNTCEKYHLAKGAIAGIASIDLKADETGILELCRNLSLPFKIFTAEQLRQVTVPTPSVVVDREVSTPSVAEAAVILAAKNDNLLVPKQVFKSDNEPGAVTVAIAPAEIEYTGRTGKLFLVGIGPGSLEQITPAAKTAISSADAIIGYSLYTNLIQPLLRVGQIIESLPITQEKQRAQRAIDLANWGLTVAVISSGDCGIYGMAGLVLEALQADNWDGNTPQVQIFPGISALQAAASRVGAPLMHDFCAISLSDLLTPWQVIVKRLQAAARGDFITAVYNPRSPKRTQQIVTTREIFLEHRPSNTPVAIVREAYRDNEEVILTTLEKMLEVKIDMLTTVIIGNHSTRNHANWMITPRGYSL